MSSLLDGLLRRLAALVVRGPLAPFVLGDLEESRARDLARGLSPARARVRYAVNAGASALRLARGRIAPFLRVPHAIGLSLPDARLGLRALVRHPVLTTVSLASLAVGIPGGLAPTHVIDAIEAPLPVEDGEAILSVRYWNVETSSPVRPSPYDLAVWREALASFAELGAARVVHHNLDAGTASGTPVSGAEVTPSTFPLLRALPLLGRTLDASDAAPGAPPVVVLGHDVWQARLGGDPGVVGGTVRVGGVPHTVVGIMPAGFLFPEHQGMWLPLRAAEVVEPGSGAPLRVFGRLADGATEASARAELEELRRGEAAARPDVYARLRAEIVPYAVESNGWPQGGLRAIPGVGLFQLLGLALLTVACANVGLLIFARTASRGAELAVRTALGASRARIVTQLFTEALVLAVLAAGAGLVLTDALANRLLGVVRSPSWGGLPYWIDLGATPGTVVRALALAVFSAAVAAVIPALRVTGKAVSRNIQRARAGGGVRFGVLSSLFVVADVALALAGVGLAAGLGARIGEIADPRELAALGAERYLAVQLTLPEASAAAPAPDSVALAVRTARLAGVQRGLLERLEAEPGVRGVALASVLPRMDHPGRLGEVEGGALGELDGLHEVEWARVDPGFFAALGQPILAGRDFHAGDLEGARSAVIVNRSFADVTLGGRSPVGRRFRYVAGGGDEPGPWHEIVGMVPDVGMNIVDRESGAGVYHAAAPGEIHPLWLAVHVGPDPASFAPRLQELVDEVDATALLGAPTSLAAVFPEDWYLMRGLRIAWAVFVGVLLALAASGIYAMMAFAVAQRTREIGIRAALGARRLDVVVVIGRRAAVQLGAGVLVGMPLAGWIYAVIQHAPDAGRAFAVAVVPGAGVLLLVGLLACTAPLLRALRIMPTEAMRSEG